MFRQACMLGLGMWTNLAPAPVIAAEPSVGHLKQFQDWIVGCDNVRNCTAIGMVPDTAGDYAYVKVARDASTNAAAVVSIVVLSQGGLQDRQVTMRLSGGSTQLPIDQMQLAATDDALREVIGAEVSDRFLAALLSGHDLDIRIDPADAPIAISLRGMSAALRYIDAEQLRAGGVTAIVATGKATAGSVPPVPEISPLQAHRLTDVGPVQETPKGLPARGDGCPDDSQAEAYRTDKGQSIFGICSFLAAYNAGTQFWLVGDGAVRQFRFEIAGSDASDDDGLINAGLDDDGLTMTGFSKGRGIGDCGSISSWAFDGTTFQLTALTEMNVCRGVAADDWPTLYSRPVVPAADRS